jgi:DNA replication protein DnaC
LKSFTATNEKCPICGKSLNKFKVEGLGRTWNVGSKRCHCKTALEIEEKAIEEQEKRKKYLESLFNQSRLGEQFFDATFDKYNVVDNNKYIFDKVKNYAMDFENNKNKSMILGGPVGRGKTFLSCAVVNMILKKGYPAIFVSVPDLFITTFSKL